MNQDGMTELAGHLRVVPELVDTKLREYHPALYAHGTKGGVVLCADVAGHSSGEVRFDIQQGNVEQKFSEALDWVRSEFDALQQEVADFHWRNEMQIDRERDS